VCLGCGRVISARWMRSVATHAVFCFRACCMHSIPIAFTSFFFNDTAPTEIYTLSLHDALPISEPSRTCASACIYGEYTVDCDPRSEEHTSELQSRGHLVCRLLLEKKK